MTNQYTATCPRCKGGAWLMLTSVACDVCDAPQQAATAPASSSPVGLSGDPLRQWLRDNPGVWVEWRGKRFCGAPGGKCLTRSGNGYPLGVLADHVVVERIAEDQSD